MKQAIYYPGFEVRDENWMKFALLYMEKLSPIVPFSADSYITPNFRKIQEETNLIKFYRPDSEVGFLASTEAMEMLDKILSHPQRYYYPFRTLNVRNKWAQRENYNYTIFRGKYNISFEDYCIENNLGQECQEGIMVSKEIGYLYMSLLANKISDREDYPAITDLEMYNRISILARNNYNKALLEELEIAKSTINLFLPENLHSLKIKDIIEFRNQSHFMDCLKAFHAELDKYLLSIEGNGNPGEFISSLNYSLQNIRAELLKLSPNLLSFGVGFWTLFNQPSSPIIEYAAEGLTIGSIAVTLGQIRREWIKTKSKRFARKYLANMYQLNQFRKL